jgi:hypothetical protein
VKAAICIIVNGRARSSSDAAICNNATAAADPDSRSVACPLLPHAPQGGLDVGLLRTGECSGHIMARPGGQLRHTPQDSQVDAPHRLYVSITGVAVYMMLYRLGAARVREREYHRDS